MGTKTIVPVLLALWMELLLYPILSQEARHVEQVSYGENKLLQGFLLQGLR